MDSNDIIIVIAVGLFMIFVILLIAFGLFVRSQL